MEIKQMSYQQLSIYDFLPEEKSQELPPSETVAQVDEAQESEKLPSSALDTRKTWEKIVDFEASLIKESTEDTDNVVTNSTLFSVGDVLTVKEASLNYTPDSDPESYYYLKDIEGKKVEFIGRVSWDQNALRCKILGTEDESLFYPHELKK